MFSLLRCIGVSTISNRPVLKVFNSIYIPPISSLVCLIATAEIKIGMLLDHFRPFSWSKSYRNPSFCI